MRLILIISFLLVNNIINGQADLILHNGKIFTSDSEYLWAEAIAIKGERILGIGKNVEVLRLKSAGTRLIDLQGNLVLPGLNDAHDHAGPLFPARRFSFIKQPFDPTPWEILKDSIARIAKEIPPGTFITTTINPELLDDPGVRREQLDEIAPNHPVMLSAWTGHGKILNSKALEYLGLDSHSSFIGGRIEKNDRTELSGLLEEYACYEVAPRWSARLRQEEIIAELKNYFAEALAFGITSVQNICTQMTTQQVQEIFKKEQFGCRVRLIAFPRTDSGNIKLNEWQKSFIPLNKLNYVSGIKLILDGTPVERLACLKHPYNDRPNVYGRLNFSESKLRDFLEFGLAQKQQIIIHAVGDSTISTIIRTMRKIHPDKFWRDKRLRIEHGELAVTEPADIQTLKQLGMVVVQNPSHLTLPKILSDRFGAARGLYAQALRSLLENDIVLAIGSDGPNNPFLNMMFATFHPDNPKEAISLQQAVIAYTYGSAYAEFKESEKGTLTRGKLADLTILSQNIFEVSPDKLPLTESILTMVGGKIVHDKKKLQ
jgi:predicted amidohydrolase YtcJ